MTTTQFTSEGLQEIEMADLGKGYEEKGQSEADGTGTVKEQAALLKTSPSLPSNALQERQNTLNHARRLLYTSHLFAQFSEVSWQFSLTLFLAAITNYESLFWVASYGLTTGSAATLLGSSTGSLVDNTNRLLAARCFILTENICIVVATLFCFLLLSRKTNEGSDGTETDTFSLCLILGIHFSGAVARVLDEGFLVAMEKDWVVVMSQFAPQEEASSWLSDTNVAMKQIDLSCKVVAPAISGLLIALVDNRSDANANDVSGPSGSQFRYAALSVGAINVLALVVEYYCTTAIYQAIPDLGKRKSLEDHESQDGSVTNGQWSLKPLPNATTTCGSCLKFFPRGFQVYLQQETSFAGIGLAMLYLNALTFDAIFTAYLVWRGMGLDTIGLWRGISSAIGLLGTCVYHLSVRRMSLEMTGQLSIVYEFLCLSLSYGSLFVHDKTDSLVMLIGGVCASRIGLWCFDIAVSQMMQESVPDGVRGVVGGVQQSLNAFFNLLSYLLGILLPNPKDFHVFVAAGYASVGIAMVLFILGTCARKRATT